MVEAGKVGREIWEEFERLYQQGKTREARDLLQRVREEVAEGVQRLPPAKGAPEPDTQPE